MAHVLVIGAYGSAGVAVADSLFDTPEIDRLTLVDDGEPGGGLCILRGCMPSKELLSAAGHRYQVRHDERIGGTTALDLETVVETKNDHIENFAAHRRAAVDAMAEADHVEFIHETARFVDERSVEVNDREFTPDYVVIATGSSISIPDIQGIEQVDYSTSADVLDAIELPDSGVVIGFGVVGMELLPYLREAGVTDLTVSEHDERPLDQADPEFGDALLDLYRDEFDIEILTQTTELALEQSTDDGVRLDVEESGTTHTIEAEHLYVFTGRQPNLDSLGLEYTQLVPETGWIEDTLQAKSDDRIYVVGDAKGVEPVLHVAKEEGFVAAENIRRQERGEALTEYTNTYHRVVFTGAGIYPYVRLGHSEASAKGADIDYISATRRAEEDGVFKTKATPRGLAKMLVRPSDGTVIGYQGLHYHADVMAKTMQVVIENEMSVDTIPDRAYHPTTPEIIDGLLRETKGHLKGGTEP